MEPASPGGEGAKKSSTALKRYGPIIGIVAVVAIVIGVLVATSGDDDDKTVTEGSSTEVSTAASSAATTPSTPDTSSASSAPSDSSTPTSEGGGEVTFPLTFTQAKDQGITVDWGDRCDPDTGRVKIPWFFAPECYAPFTGDNGGATAQGVTADEITVAVYIAQEHDPIIDYITDAIHNDETNAQVEDTYRGLIPFYEAYYETYGRKVKMEFVEGSGGAADDVAARADAVHIAQDIKPFMVWGGPALTSAFADELAANDIQCLDCTPGQPPDFYTQRDPLIWNIAAGAEQEQIHALEMIQKILIGKNATHAGEEFVNSPRKFGYLYIESSATSAALAQKFADTMAANGAPLAETVSYQLDPGTIQQSASQAIAKFKAAGVTTVILSADPVAPREFTKEATAQGYFPEWVLAVSTLVDTNAFSRTYDQEQWKHAFGFTAGAAKTNPETSGQNFLYTWFNGTPPPAPITSEILYDPSLFYAVLQGVGPNLTHETFRDALFAGTQSRVALTQPSLGWGDKGIWPDPDYAGVDDGTLIWWDESVSGPDEVRKTGQGMWEYVDGGKRFLPGAWPTDDKFFDPTGAVSLYTDPPADETPPSYPSPAG